MLEFLVKELVNRYRVRNSQEPLIYDEQLCTMAAQHSESMKNKKVKFGHSDLRKRVKDFRFINKNKLRNVRENVILLRDKGNNVSNELELVKRLAITCVNGWIKSATHRRNLLVPNGIYQGIGVADKNDKYWITQIII